MRAYITVSPDQTVSTLHIDGLRFDGKYVTSPDGQYTFGWGRHAGYSDCQIVLLRGDVVVWYGTVPGCWRAAVSNNGYSALLYGLPQDNGSSCYSSILYLFSTFGEIVRHWRFTYAYSVALSPDGDLLCFNIASAAGAAPEDAYTLCIFATSDMDVRPLLQTDFDGHDLHSIRAEQGTFIVGADGVQYIYSADGKLINDLEADWHNAKLAESQNHAHRLFWLAERRLSRAVGHQQQADKDFVLWALRTALSQRHSSTWIRARAARVLGELALGEGNLEEARQQLSVAIALQPNCGAKRLLERIEVNNAGVAAEKTRRKPAPAKLP